MDEARRRRLEQEDNESIEYARSRGMKYYDSPDVNDGNYGLSGTVSSRREREQRAARPPESSSREAVQEEVVQETESLSARLRKFLGTLFGKSK
jgi:hypothetical protein